MSPAKWGLDKLVWSCDIKLMTSIYNVATIYGKIVQKKRKLVLK